MELLEALEAREQSLACHEASCAPPPVGTGGSSPKGGPGRGHLSPTDSGRVVPTPLYTTVAAMRAAHGGSDSSLKEALLKVYGGEDIAKGYEFSVNNISVLSDRVEIRGSIASLDGDLVGSYKRSLEFYAGDIIAHHDVINIQASHQGKGIAQKFNDHLLDYYNKIGVDRIELEAALSHGPYAWARQGYRFDGNSYFGVVDLEMQRKRWVNDRLRFVTAHAYSVDAKNNPNGPSPEYLEFEKEVKDLNQASQRGADVQPIHVAALGESLPALHENGVWPGKAALIEGHDNYTNLRTWNGVYYLGHESAVTAALYRRMVDEYGT